MSIKSILQKIIPSFYVGCKTETRLKKLSLELSNNTDLSKQIEDRINVLDSKIEYLFFLSQSKPDENELSTKKRVFLNLPKASGELRSIQLAENYILKRVKEHADKLNIDFFLMGGTALGAVRHKGFIPWDDDVDIGMLHDDYLLLKQAIDKDELISVKRYYQAYGGSLIKVKFRFSENFYIDIFTFDQLAVDESRIDEYWEKSQNYTKEYSEKVREKLIELKMVELAGVAPVYDSCLDEYAQSLYRSYQSDLSAEFSSSKENYISESIANGFAFRGSRKYWRIDESFPLLKDEVEFEGNTYSMINNYQKRLEIFFGDIWCFPKSVKRLHNSEFDEKISDEILKLKEMSII